jgi:hypothetical protein
MKLGWKSLVNSYLPEGEILPKLTTKEEKKLLRNLSLLKALDKEEAKKKFEHINRVRRSEGLDPKDSIGKFVPYNKEVPFKVGNWVINKKTKVKGVVRQINKEKGVIIIESEFSDSFGQNTPIYIYFKFKNENDYKVKLDKGKTIEQWSRITTPTVSTGPG